MVVMGKKMGFKAAPITAMCSGYIVVTVVRRSEEKGDRKWCICCDDSIEKFWQWAYTVGLSPQFKRLARMNLSNGFLKDLCRCYLDWGLNVIGLRGRHSHRISHRSFDRYTCTCKLINEAQKQPADKGIGWSVNQASNAEAPKTHSEHQKRER